MRKFLTMLASTAILLSAVLVPVAIATHITEPQTPVTAVQFNVLHYATGTPAPCNGGVFEFNKVRLQLYATIASAPSEHFDVKVAAEHLVVNNKGDLVIEDRNARDWPHQNVPPHGHLTKFPILGTGSNEAGMDAGVWHFTAHLEGTESGNVFFRECTFEVVT